MARVLVQETLFDSLTLYLYDFHFDKELRSFRFLSILKLPRDTQASRATIRGYETDANFTEV